MDLAEVKRGRDAPGQGVANAAAERVEQVFFRMAAAGLRQALARQTRAFSPLMELFLDLGDALFQHGELGDGHHVGKDGS